MSSDTAAIADLHRAFAVQQKAFLADQYPSLETRVGNLHKLAGMMMANRQAIKDALDKDFGSHPEGASDVVEILGPAGRAMFVATQLAEWMKDEPRYVDPALYGNATAVVHREAKGVIGTIVPFNFPFDLSAGPLVEQLAGGNRAILKPSEFTPACADLLKKMIGETFPEDLVYVVVGGMELGVEFSKLKWNHLLYTGSPNVGKLVMAEAAKNLTPVTLELGGKCPSIIAPGHVTERNVENILGTKMLKNGQMCVTIDYVLVPDTELDAFVDLAKAYLVKLGAYSKSKDCCGIITDRHLNRLVAMLDEAKKAGANVIVPEVDGVVNPATRQMPLSLIVNPAPTLQLSREEIFGPILPIISYSTLEKAVEHVNNDERPLALYVFGEGDEVDFVIKNTKSGGTAVNSCALQAALPSLGFGGIGNSGMGRHHGLEGFREFTNPKGLVSRGTAPDLIAAFGPPYAVASAIADHAFAQAAAGSA